MTNLAPKTILAKRFTEKIYLWITQPLFERPNLNIVMGLAYLGQGIPPAWC